MKLQCLKVFAEFRHDIFFNKVIVSRNRQGGNGTREAENKKNQPPRRFTSLGVQFIHSRAQGSSPLSSMSPLLLLLLLVVLQISRSSDMEQDGLEARAAWVLDMAVRIWRGSKVTAVIVSPKHAICAKWTSGSRHLVRVVSFSGHLSTREREVVIS